MHGLDEELRQAGVVGVIILFILQLGDYISFKAPSDYRLYLAPLLLIVIGNYFKKYESYNERVFPALSNRQTLLILGVAMILISYSIGSKAISPNAPQWMQKIKTVFPSFDTLFLILIIDGIVILIIDSEVLRRRQQAYQESKTTNLRVYHHGR